MNAKSSLKEALRLYLVSDSKGSLETLLLAVEKSLMGGVTLVQYRDKEKSEADKYAEASALKALCDRYGTSLIVNDDVALAVKLNAAGAHVGQSDLEAGQARAALGPDKWLGVSVSSVKEALEAQSAGADYLGVGAVFSTQTKLDAQAVSLECLEAICQAVHIPVVAIGGIQVDNVHRLCKRGLAGIAVVSALLSAESPETSARALLSVDL